MRPLLLLLPASVLLLWAPPARACASCACGDPTLTSMGAEQPFRGRLRTAATLRAWGLVTGTSPLDEQQLSEVRLDLAAAYSPVDWLTLSAQLPLQRREVRFPDLARETSWGVGELELAGRAVVWRDRMFAPRLLVSALAGVKLPTSPRQVTADGVPLSLDAQLGTGSWDALGGLALLGFAGKWSGLLSVSGVLPGRGHEGFRPGRALHSSLFAQRHLLPWLAVRLGMDARLEEASRHPVLGPEGGGLLVQASPDVLLRLLGEGVLQVGARLPVVNPLVDGQRFSPALQATFAYDL